VLLVATCLVTACRGNQASPAAAAPSLPPAMPSVERLVVKVVASYPHDRSAFTQGLVWHDGRLYEGTGLVGASSLRLVDLASGAVQRQVDLPAEVFGEGLALAGGRLVQLTWHDGRAFFWDPATFAPLGETRYRGEGWGLTFDGTRLVQSDGSAELTFRDPVSFAPLGRLEVREDGRPVSQLNELEAVGGDVWANLWSSDELVRIEVATGRVTARVDASPLRRLAQEAAGGQPIDVLNGIAHRPEAGTFLLTGKLWPLLFEVELVPAG
jgi:glutamine cyclotransferase